MNLPELLETLLKEAEEHLSEPFVADADLRQKVGFICRCNTNKAPIRLMLTCLLAKTDQPDVDIRKPYTEIAGEGTYSGRVYDEKFLTPFLDLHKLPCNPTTAFLTPALRNINRALTTDLNLEGKPKEVYEQALSLLHTVQENRIAAHVLLKEFLRTLLIIRAENDGRMQQLLSVLKRPEDALALSAEQILTLLHQHLQCKNSSRLPVLMVAAAYLSVAEKLGEMALPLRSHNAADKQTGSIGDLEIVLKDDANIVTCYEMKDKRVTITDLNHALSKVVASKKRIDNYIFVTTDLIDLEVTEHANPCMKQVVSRSRCSTTGTLSSTSCTFFTATALNSWTFTKHWCLPNPIVPSGSR